MKETTTTIKCDICGRTEAESHSFVCGRIANVPGDMDDDWYDADLCNIHFDDLVSKHGHPGEYKERLVGRKTRIAYGVRVKEWIQSQMGVWSRMSDADRRLAMEIESLGAAKGE